MGINNLTTGDQDPQVNVEIQDDNNTSEVMVDESANESTNVDESLSNEPDTSAYDSAWDSVDINDDSIFEKTFNSSNDETSDVPAVQSNDPLSTTQETNNNIGAFIVNKPVLKYKGKDIPIDTEAELIALAQKGFQMETEAANMKPKKKALAIIDGIPLETLQALADINGGNTEAISYIKEQYGIKDTIQASNDDNFWDGNEKAETPVAKPAYTPDVAVDNPIDEFWNSYSSNNQQAAAKASDIYSGLDESFKVEVYTPEIFPAFVQSVESGEFDIAYPIAIKEKSLNPAMTWIQAYQVAVQKSGTKVQPQAEPPVSAAPPTNTAAPRNHEIGNDADRVWNDDAYFNELEAKLFG